MYLCNCNGVTRSEAEEAIAAGTRGPEAVLAHHGCEPCCGRCLPEIADEIAEAIAGDGTAQTGSLVAAE